MAFAPTDDKEKDQQSTQDQSGAGTQSPGSSSGSSAGAAGAAGPAGGGAISTAGVGAGGQNAWTNMQAYLNANQGNTSSADTVSKQVGGAFDQEKSGFDKASQSTKDQATQAASAGNIGQDAASKMIQQAGSGYYSGQTPGQDASYQSSLQPIKDYLNSSYQGPTNFNYGMGEDANRAGEALGSDKAFQGYMGDIYNKAAGGQMSQGQLALQQGLDTNNQALNQARQDLMARYSGLSDTESKGITDTNAALGDAAKQFGAQQSGLKDYLSSKLGGDQDTYNHLASEASNTGAEIYGSGSRDVIDLLQPDYDRAKQSAGEYNAIQDLLGGKAMDTGFNPATTGSRIEEYNPNSPNHENTLTDLRRKSLAGGNYER